MPGTPRDEFGVCVGDESSCNGSIMVYFPDRDTHIISTGFHLRPSSSFVPGEIPSASHPPYKAPRCEIEATSPPPHRVSSMRLTGSIPMDQVVGAKTVTCGPSIDPPERLSPTNE